MHAATLWVVQVPELRAIEFIAVGTTAKPHRQLPTPCVVERTVLSQEPHRADAHTFKLIDRLDQLIAQFRWPALCELQMGHVERTLRERTFPDRQSLQLNQERFGVERLERRRC